MYVYTCADDFESMMTCIYDVWADKRGSKNVRLEIEPIGQRELFSTYICVEKDEEKAIKVSDSIRKKISQEAFRQIYLAAMSDAMDRLDAIYRFLLLGFSYGGEVTKRLADAPVMRLFELSRRAGNDMHYYREFTRFVRIEPGIYVAHIEPACNIAVPVADHFADRMPSEHWMIIDDKRSLAVVHQKDEPYYVTPLDEKERKKLQTIEKQKDIYTDLWKEFFRTIAIKERENPTCQRNHMPLHYRKYVTEFME